MIDFRHVSAGRPGVTLFKDFTWRIEAGENWLIQGPNGSGKTLLLELIAGKVHPIAGALDIDFINGSTWDERHVQRKRLIHYVPTHAVQFLLKQDQHQYYQQRYYSIGDQQQPTVRDLLAGGIERLATLNLPNEFTINDLLSVEVNRLSNGQLKKLLLVKVLLTGVPCLLLLDYPFEGLDHGSRLALCRFIDYLIQEYRMQVVIVDQHNEVPACINRILTLRDFNVERVDKYTARDESFRSREQQARGSSAPTEEISTTDAVVEVLDLRIQYGDRVILENFNWRVNKGERWALVGKNGAGKTTLFSMIFADHPMAYSQQVYLFGRRRGTGESIWDIKRRISYLGPEQLSYLSPAHIHVPARDYLLRSIRLHGEQLLNRLITAFRAEEFLDLPVRVLSSGQLQVLLLMQCLLTDCELLLLDEPYQFLDSERTAALNSILTHYLDKNKTLILITHYAADLTQWTNNTKHL